MSLLTVIPVHGIWERPPPADPRATLAYSGAFARRVVAELRRLGVVPPGADAATVAAIVRFDPVQYADIGAAEEQAIYERYRRQAARRGSLADRALERLAFDRLRRFVITGAGDVLLYQSARFKEEIRDRLRARIAAAIAAGDGAVTLVGHSLGSIVCYDVAYYDSYHSRHWRERGFALANLLTLGSPLALFGLVADDRGRPKSKYTDPGAIETLVRPGGRWLNFFDAQDLVGYPLEATFPGHVRDLPVQTGLLPTTAHARLWHSAAVARGLATCLRDDYRRLTSDEG
jgi:hypothetical protein